MEIWWLKNYDWANESPFSNWCARGFYWWHIILSLIRMRDYTMVGTPAVMNICVIWIWVNLAVTDIISEVFDELKENQIYFVINICVSYPASTNQRWFIRIIKLMMVLYDFLSEAQWIDVLQNCMLSLENAPEQNDECPRARAKFLQNTIMNAQDMCVTFRQNSCLLLVWYKLR